MKFLKFIKSKFNKTFVSLFLLSLIVFTPVFSAFADWEEGIGDIGSGGVMKGNVTWNFIPLSGNTYEEKIYQIDTWISEHPKIMPNGKLWTFQSLDQYKAFLRTKGGGIIQDINITDTTEFIILPTKKNTDYLFGNAQTTFQYDNVSSNMPQWVEDELAKRVDGKTVYWAFTSNSLAKYYTPTYLRVRVYKETSTCKGTPFVSPGDGDEPPGCTFNDRVGNKNWTVKINYAEYFDNSEHYLYNKTNVTSGERYGATDYDTWRSPRDLLKASLVNLPDFYESTSGTFTFQLLHTGREWQTLNLFVKQKPINLRVRVYKESETCKGSPHLVHGDGKDPKGCTMNDRLGEKDWKAKVNYSKYFNNSSNYVYPNQKVAKGDERYGATKYDVWNYPSENKLKASLIKLPEGYESVQDNYEFSFLKGGNGWQTLNYFVKEEKTKPKPPPEEPKDCGEWKDYTPDEKQDKIEGVYEVKTVITPITPKGFSDWDEETQKYWNSTHHKQERTELTPLGKYLKSQGDIVKKLTSADNETTAYMDMWNKLVEGANKAIKEGVQKVNIELTSKNKEGFARGGIFTVTELRKDVNISTVHTQDREQYYKCVFKLEKKTRKVWDEKKKKYVEEEYYEYVKTGYEKTGKIRSKKNPYTKAVTNTTNSWYIHSSWQYLSARCNKDGIEKARVASKGKDITFGSHYGSTAIESPLVYGTTAKFYGNPFHKNKDLAETGKAEFFTTNTSCEEKTLCTPDKMYKSNDSINNVLDDSKYNILNGKYGAQHDETTATSEFSFFRDNVFKEVRNDVWYPISPAVEIDDQKGKPAHVTFFAFDKKGTPQDELFSFGKTDKEDYIDGKVKKLPTDNIVEATGQVNRFGFRGAFASEKENPHRMNIKYGWKTKILNHVPTIVNGRQHEKLVPLPSDINMYCDVLFNTKEKGHAIFENTPMWRKFQAPKEFNDKENNSMKIRFVKTSVE